MKCKTKKWLNLFKEAAVIIAIIVIILILSVVIKTPAYAGEWYASHTVTLEPETTIYTACLEYDFSNWWAANITFDYHQQYGLACDLSTTVYIPFNDHIYSTVGLRKPGNEHPEKRGLVPYLSVTYRF